ncbi:MAG: InlB B-repeat-containing protein, partial [Prevotella sp.]|nr:InlB B-repeat-containing protein [Prevotella sp.]
MNDLQSNVNLYNIFKVSATADKNMGSVTIEPAVDAAESGTSITATATAVDGYSFVNWTDSETEVSTKNPYKFDLAANTALTANFKAIAYPVVFKNDGAEVQKGDLDFASVITAPENPTKVGYKFLGWYAGETLFVEGATVPLNGVTYEAKWQINQYTITFDTDGGSEVAAITQDYASAITAPEKPTKTGYTFAGWDSEIPATMPAENKTIKATWTINSYVVKFVADDAVVSEKTLEYGSAITAPEVPAKEGHTGAWVDVAETVPAEDVTYTAVYTPINYTITFDTDGGSEVAAITLPYGSAITAPENPTKEGYTFNAWDPVLPETMPVDGFQTKATWTINQYTVK